MLVLVLMPALFAEAGGRTVPSHRLALVKVVALGGLTILVGGRVLPWLLRQVRDPSRELFTLTVLSWPSASPCLGQVFGVSMALGAFLAGMVVGRSDFSVRAASEALPMRDAFAVLFFVSVGMLFDPGSWRDDPLMLAATLAIVLIGKPLAALVIVLLFRYPLRVACRSPWHWRRSASSRSSSPRGQRLGVLTADATNASSPPPSCRSRSTRCCTAASAGSSAGWPTTAPP